MQDQNRDVLVSAQRARGSAIPITSQDLDVLFTGLIRSRAFFDDARRLVRRNQFHPVAEGQYQLLWDTLCLLRDNYEVWTTDMVLAEIYRVLAHNPGLIAPYHQMQLTRQDQAGIVWAAFHVPAEGVHIPYCRDLLQRFLSERTIATPLRLFMESAGPDSIPEDLPTFLQRITEQQTLIRGMREMPLVETVPPLDTQLDPSSTFHMTGVPYIDGPLGGMREGDANGIIGVTGAGKSTIGAHMAVAMSRLCYDQAAQSNQPPAIVAFFTYEESARKMYPRIWSAAFKINRNKLERMTHPASQLTTRDNMEEYERRLSEREGQALCEQERWVVGSVWLNATLKLFDMSGSNDFPQAGSGHIPEIATCLDNLVSAGHRIRAVIVDYAGLVCKRYMQAADLSDDALRTELSKFGDRMRREVSERFSCTSWILHQIAAAEGTKNPLKLLHHSQAAESKSFAENMAVCGCIGVPDPHTGLRRLNWSKVRYAPNEQVAPITLKINDQFAIMEDMTSAFTIDELSQRFVARDSEQRFQGQTANNGTTTPATTPATQRPPRPRALADETGMG